MFSTTVALGNLSGAEERFTAAYRGAVDEMKALLDAHASAEREADPYQDRTGDLRASTKASDVVSGADSDQVWLIADTPYAAYVNRRGLMTIDEHAAEATTELAYLFDSLALVI